MANQKLSMVDKLDLNYHADGQANDQGVLYRMTESSKAYATLDETTGLVTPVKPGTIQVDVLDATTKLPIEVVFIEIETEAEVEFRAQVAAGAIKHVRDFVKMANANAPGPVPGVEIDRSGFTASSSSQYGGVDFYPDKVLDGNPQSRWMSDYIAAPDLNILFGQTVQLGKVDITAILGGEALPAVTSGMAPYGHPKAVKIYTTTNGGASWEYDSKVALADTSAAQSALLTYPGACNGVRLRFVDGAYGSDVAAYYQIADLKFFTPASNQAAPTLAANELDRSGFTASSTSLYGDANYAPARVLDRSPESRYMSDYGAVAPLQILFGSAKQLARVDVSAILGRDADPAIANGSLAELGRPRKVKIYTTANGGSSWQLDSDLVLADVATAQQLALAAPGNYDGVRLDFYGGTFGRAVDDIWAYYNVADVKFFSA